MSNENSSGLAWAGGGGVMIVALIVIFVCICGGCGSGGSDEKSYCDGPFAAIKTESDLDDLTSCSSYDGSVEIDSSFTGSLDLGGTLMGITGNLKCSGASNLTSITAEALSTVGGSLVINHLSRLENASFPALSQIDGALDLQGLPSLQSVDGFSALTEVGSLNIKGNVSNSNFPSLSQIINGATIILSTTDDSFCRYITELRNSSGSTHGISCITGSKQPATTSGIIAGGAFAGILLLGASTMRQRSVVLGKKREPRVADTATPPESPTENTD